MQLEKSSSLNSQIIKIYLRFRPPSRANAPAVMATCTERTRWIYEALTFSFDNRSDRPAARTRQEPVCRLSDGTVQLWNSCWYFPLLLLVMLAALATGQPVLGVIVLGLLASWFLAFCPDLVAAITPFGMIFLLSTSEYETSAASCRACSC